MPLGTYIPNNLTVDYYKLDSNSNSSATGGHNGTDSSITYAVGRFSGCAPFDGTNSYITIADSDTWNFTYTGKRTVSFWIKPNNITSTRYILSSYRNSDEYISYNIKDEGKISFSYSQSFISSASYVTGSILTTTDWQNVIVTYNNRVVKIYKNGVLQANTKTGAISSTPGSMVSSYLGRFGNSSDTKYDGSLEEVIIENSEWTDAKCKNYYNQSVGRFRPRTTIV